MTSGRLLFILMWPTLIIDAVNGWLIRNISSTISLSQVYRLTLLVLILLWLTKYKKNGAIVFLFCLLILEMGTFYHSFSYEEISWLIFDIHFHFRMLFHFLFFLFFYTLSQRIYQVIELEKLYKKLRVLFLFSYAVMVVNIVLGSIGIGYSTVDKFGGGDDGYGGLGFFKAGNDVSATFLIIAGVLMYFSWTEKKKIQSYILVGLFSVLIAVLLQTKAIIAGTLILFGGIPIISSGLITEKWRIKLKPTLLIIVSTTTIMSIGVWLVYSNAGIVQKFMFFYEKSGLLFALLTGRSYFLEIALVVLDTSYEGLDFLFGHGWSMYLKEMGALYSKEKLVEIDYIDIFMINGVSGLMVELSIWMFYLVMAFRGAKRSSLARMVLFLDLLMLGIAGTAGHVLYSTMNSMFVGLLNALPYVERALRQADRKHLVGNHEAVHP